MAIVRYPPEPPRPPPLVDRAKLLRGGEHVGYRVEMLGHVYELYGTDLQDPDELWSEWWVTKDGVKVREGRVHRYQSGAICDSTEDYKALAGDVSEGRAVARSLFGWKALVERISGRGRVVSALTRTNLMHNGEHVGYRVVAQGVVYDWRCRGWLTKDNQRCDAHPYTGADHYESYISRDGVRISYSEPHDSGQYAGAHRHPDGTDLDLSADHHLLEIVQALQGDTEVDVEQE